MVQNLKFEIFKSYYFSYIILQKSKSKIKIFNIFILKSIKKIIESYFKIKYILKFKKFIK